MAGWMPFPCPRSSPHGRWDAVLPQVAQLKLPRSKLEDLYEQVGGQGPCTHVAREVPCSHVGSQGPCMAAAMEEPCTHVARCLGGIQEACMPAAMAPCMGRVQGEWAVQAHGCIQAKMKGSEARDWGSQLSLPDGWLCPYSVWGGRG